MAEDYPRAIFYDSKTTIFDWDAQWLDAAAEILDRYDAAVDPEPFRDRWIRSMSGHFLRAAFYEYRDLDPCVEEALGDAFAHFGIEGDPADVEAFTRRYDEVQPFPEADEALARQQEHTDVIVFSNVESRYLDMMVEKLAVEPDFVGTMEDAGAIKPSPYAYRWVLDEMGLEPEEVLYCAAPLFDVNGAMAFGMPCAYLNRPSQEYEPPQREAHYEVSDLLELAELLEAGELTAPDACEPGRRA